MANRVCEFEMIQGDQELNVPVTSGASEFPITTTLKVPGIQVGFCVLLFSVRNMTSGEATVHINGGASIGKIKPTSGTIESAQMIAFAQAFGGFHAGDNKIALQNVTEAFKISNIVLFYHKII